MNFRLILKVVAVFFVSLLLLVPIGRVESLVYERQVLRDQVVADIAKSAGYAQTVNGPYLIVPYEQRTKRWTEETNDKPRQLIEYTTQGEFVFLPQKFHAKGNVDIQERARGIYKARMFGLSSDLVGEFDIEPNYGIKENVGDYNFGTPYLVLGLSDIRGIGAELKLQWDDAQASFAPNTTPPGSVRGPALANVLSSGVHAMLPLQAATEAQVRAFAIHLSLQGTSEIRIAPVGRSTQVELASNWPHPSFIGDFLPKAHTITDKGFDATWETSFFATNLEGLAERCHSAVEGACSELAGKTFAVSFVDPVDHYLKSERATKYAFLFVGLTFALFFLFEVLRRFSVHPVQYGLVGLALAVFFLLLLSLAEHLGFALAYGISACSSVLLIGYYVVPILGSVRNAAGFSAALGVLYGVLYGILSSEDYALLTGSLVVFGVLGLVMVVTRNVNWTKFGQPLGLAEPPAGPPAPPVPPVSSEAAS